MDRLQSMRVFLRVAEEGGFAAAARRLDLDPAVVTRLVADLEKYLDSPLLQRTTRRVSLTPAGDEYLVRVRAILAEIDEADASIRGQATELRGRLRVLSVSTIATHILAPALRGFLSRYPDIQVEIRTFESGDPPPLEDYDLTFVSARTALPTDIVTRELAIGDFALYASIDYLERHGVPETGADLARHRLLRQRLAGESLDRLRLFDPDRNQEQEVEVTPVMVTDSPSPLLSATLSGVGISSQGQTIGARYIAAGQLRRVLDPWITSRATLLAAYPSRRFLPARARVFLEEIATAVQANFAQVARQGR
jgi:DNA-binding transcriptional LysR family regulator